ncbi:MAG: hypothetical protein LBU64_05475 [Planctomycetota bacterium]|jgi:hypothetical protein|nr:hypothetical protein [Planctomycetota bacterium]
MGTEIFYRDDWSVEAALDGSEGKGNLRALLDHLSQKRASFKRKLDRGVTKDEFARGEAILKAYDAAMGGLEIAGGK